MKITYHNAPTVIAYGGTFDPPHNGHVAMAGLALARFPEAKLYVLPAARPVRRVGAEKRVAASFEHRVAMAQLAFATLGPRLQVVRWEELLPQPNYTIQTLSYISSQFPSERLAFLLGQDQWAAFTAWQQPKQILAVADLIVVAREGQTASLPEVTATIAARLHLTFEWNETLDTARCVETQHSLYLVPQPISQASSTLVRSEIHHSGTDGAAWLPPAVGAYIKQHRLYLEAVASEDPL